MKLYVKQMFDWNSYAFFAEDVEERYWYYFRDELWWQLGSSFIKTFDNVKDFEYCAKNFTRCGEVAVSQQLKIQPAPWEKALELFVPEMKELGVDWYIHGSTAMALWGIDVVPKDINIIIPNASDFDRVREHFYMRALRPFERCEGWLMSGLGSIFMEANIEFAFHNKAEEPFDMSSLHKLRYKGTDIYLSTLKMLKIDNENFGRPDRAALIGAKMEKIK